MTDSDGLKTPDISDHVDTDEDEDLRRALKKEHAKIELPGFPTMLSLHAFKLAVVEHTVTASCRSDHHRVVRWIRLVDRPGIKMKQLDPPGRNYRTLDCKLATALLKFQTGEFGRRVNIMKKRVMRKDKGKLLCGRQILWMLYNHFRTNKNLGQIHSIVDLARIQWRGDGQIEAFRNDWESLVEGLPYKTSRTYMAELLLDQLTKSIVLKSKVDKYKKKYPSRRKSYSKLLAIIDRYLHDRQEVENRKKLEQEQARQNNKHPSAPARVSNCQFFMRGQCDKGKDCPNLHDAKLKGYMASEVAPVKGGKSKSGAKSSGKGKSSSSGRGKGKSSSQPSGKGSGSANRSPSVSGKGKGNGGRKTLCAWFQVGKCAERNCPFLHEKVESERIAQRLEQIRSRSSSRANSPAAASGGKRPCFAWVKRGSCEHGKSCQYLHDPDKRGKGGGKTSAPAAKANPRPKGKARARSGSRSSG